jgi:hypothetical protein
LDVIRAFTTAACHRLFSTASFTLLTHPIIVGTQTRTGNVRRDNCRLSRPARRCGRPGPPYAARAFSARRRQVWRAAFPPGRAEDRIRVYTESVSSLSPQGFRPAPVRAALFSGRLRKGRHGYSPHLRTHQTIRRLSDPLQPSASRRVRRQRRKYRRHSVLHHSRQFISQCRH